MALAILDLLAFEGSRASFRVDTGTSRFYQLKVGRAVRRTHGADWVDDVVLSTPVATNDRSGDSLGSSINVSVPLGGFDGGRAYVQLYSYKSAGGKSPAFSRIVTIPAGLTMPAGAPPELPALSLSNAMSLQRALSFHPARIVPCRTQADQFARQASLDALLAGIVKVAGPALLALLSDAKNDTAPIGATPAPTGAPSPASTFAALLKAVLAATAPAAPPVSAAQSLRDRSTQANRFNGHGTRLSRPFIFGVDDALIGMLAGPIVQALPQLMNEANERRLQTRQADNKLVTDILSEVNRRMLLNQLLQAKNQPVAPEAPPADQAELDALVQLLRQVPAAPVPASPPPASPPLTSVVVPAALPAKPVVPAPALSVAQTVGASATTSRRAVLSFDMAPAVTWNGAQKAVFSGDTGLQLKVRLKVAGTPPTALLPKALLTIVFKEGDAVRLESTFKQKDVAADGVMSCAFSAEDVSRLPSNVNLSVVARLRWPARDGGREYSALGATDIVVVKAVFAREQGSAVSPPRELRDMKQFRPFWNKFWEAPLLDGARSGSAPEKKYRWELDANAKYSVLLAPNQEANGLMVTKLAERPPDPESLTAKTEGRMKGGVELSILELNKLLPLWDGETALEGDRLAALRTDALAAANDGELVYNLKLKGKAAERGMIWMVPVLRLFELTLSTVARTDDTGQVANVTDEKVRFPLPVSVRIIGVRSSEEEPDEDAAADAGAEGYSFDGFAIAFADTVMLTQAGG